MMLPRSVISLLDSGPGHSVFMAGAVGSPAKPRREDDAAVADVATAFLVGRTQKIALIFQFKSLFRTWCEILLGQPNQGSYKKVTV